MMVVLDLSSQLYKDIRGVLKGTGNDALLKRLLKDQKPSPKKDEEETK